LRLEYVHSRHFVHRDIKPSNVLIGTGGHRDTISIIDFGLAKQYRDKNTHTHIPYRTNHRFVGTAAFASINNHDGLEQSRRDDLESLAYVLIYFLRGSLPWYGGDYAINNTRRSKRSKKHRLKDAKADLRIKLITDSLPGEFATLLDYARALEYNEMPDYSYLRNLFGDLLRREGLENDGAFDWHTINTMPNDVATNSEVKMAKHVTKDDSKPARRV